MRNDLSHLDGRPIELAQAAERRECSMVLQRDGTYRIRTWRTVLHTL